jgi:hypothetical protein
LAAQILIPEIPVARFVQPEHFDRFQRTLSCCDPTGGSTASLRRLCERCKTRASKSVPPVRPQPVEVPQNLPSDVEVQSASPASNSSLSLPRVCTGLRVEPV